MNGEEDEYIVIKWKTRVVIVLIDVSEQNLKIYRGEFNNYK